MLICESYLLVSLDESEGKHYVRISTSKNKCLAGACIIDLILRKKAVIENNKLRIIDGSSTGNMYLDEILNILNDSKLRKLKNWINILSITHKIKIYDLILKSLENQGILSLEKEKYLKILIKWGYIFIRPEVKQALLERIHQVIHNNLDTDFEAFCLLRLLQKSYSIKYVIAKEYRNLANNRIKQLNLYGRFVLEHQEMLLKIIKAIKDSMRGRIIV